MSTPKDDGDVVAGGPAGLGGGENKPEDEKQKQEADVVLSAANAKEAAQVDVQLQQEKEQKEREQVAKPKAEAETPKTTKEESEEDKKKAAAAKAAAESAKLKSAYDKALEEQQKKGGLSWESIGGGIATGLSSGPGTIVKDAKEGLQFGKDVAKGTANLFKRKKKESTVELGASASPSTLELASMAIDAVSKLKEIKETEKKEKAEKEADTMTTPAAAAAAAAATDTATATAKTESQTSPKPTEPLIVISAADREPAKQAEAAPAVPETEPEPETESERRERGIEVATDLLEKQETLWKSRKDLVPPPSEAERALAKEATEKKVDTEAARNAQAKCEKYDKEVKQYDDQLKAIREKQDVLNNPTNPERQKVAAEVLSNEVERLEQAKANQTRVPEGHDRYEAMKAHRSQLRQDIQDKNNLIEALKPPTLEASAKDAAAKAVAAKETTKKDADVKDVADKTAAQKAEPKPAEIKPAEPKPVESKPAEPKPAESKPAEPASNAPETAAPSTTAPSTAAPSTSTTSPGLQPASNVSYTPPAETSKPEPAKGGSEPSTPSSSSDSSSTPSSSSSTDGSSAEGGGPLSGVSKEVALSAAKKGLEVADKVLDVASDVVNFAEKILPEGMAPMLEGAKHMVSDLKESVSMAKDMISGNAVGAMQKQQESRGNAALSAVSETLSPEERAAVKPAVSPSQPQPSAEVAQPKPSEPAKPEFTGARSSGERVSDTADNAALPRDSCCFCIAPTAFCRTADEQVHEDLIGPCRIYETGNFRNKAHVIDRA